MQVDLDKREREREPFQSGGEALFDHSSSLALSHPLVRVAGGVWTWNRLFAALPFTFQASQACLDACKRNQIGNVFVTLWGDDGNEYDFVSALPGILYFAESGFSGADTSLDPATLKNRFAAVCGGNWDDWVAASAIDSVITHIPVDERTHFPPNMSKWLLWQDMTYSLFSPQCNDIHMGKFYYEV